MENPTPPPWTCPGSENLAWFLWEPQHPPPVNRWFHVLFHDGDETSALFQSDGRWWCLRHGHVEPHFWREAPYHSRSGLTGSRVS